MNLKGSSLRVGHERERRDSEEESLSFCKGKGVEDDEDNDDERESSSVSAIWSTKGSERAAYGVRIEMDFEEIEGFGLGLK